MLNEHQLAATIAGHASRKQLALGGPAIQQDFCHIWPLVKPVLTQFAAMAGVFSIVPYVGAASGVIEAFIKIADDIAGTVCTTPSTVPTTQ